MINSANACRETSEYDMVCLGSIVHRNRAYHSFSNSDWWK